jgi:hypothetical protein
VKLLLLSVVAYRKKRFHEFCHTRKQGGGMWQEYYSLRPSMRIKLERYNPGVLLFLTLTSTNSHRQSDMHYIA